MSSLNKWIGIGNIGGEVTMRFSPTGRPVTNFAIATNRSYKGSDGEQKKDTQWFDVIVWGKQAELCNQFLSKGQRVYVEGRISTRSWDGQDGVKHFKVEVHATNVMFLDKKSGSSSGATREIADDSETDELPFE